MNCLLDLLSDSPTSSCIAPQNMTPATVKPMERNERAHPWMKDFHRTRHNRKFPAQRIPAHIFIVNISKWCRCTKLRAPGLTYQAHWCVDLWRLLNRYSWREIKSTIRMLGRPLRSWKCCRCGWSWCFQSNFQPDLHRLEPNQNSKTGSPWGFDN